MSLLTVRGLSKSFGGVRALSSLGLSVAEGELVALIGPNGAGKTTCFNLLHGQLQPDAGEILFDGRSVAGLAPRELLRRGIGRTFQITAVFGSMTVLENVQVALLAHERKILDFIKKTEKFKVKDATDLLALAGLVALASRPCAELAYGDLKRVELAIALASRPRLLLMDEPTAGIAGAERHALMELVAGLARRSRTAVLFTEHDMDVVFRHAGRVLVLAEGELIAEGAPEAVRGDARVRRVYLGEGADA